MAVSFYSTNINVTGAPLVTGNNDLISVEATGNVYSTNGVVISIGALSSTNQIQIEGDVISTASSSAIDVLGQYNTITLDETGSVSTQGAFGVGVNLQGHNNQLYNQGTITAETGVNLGLGQGNQVINDGAIVASYSGVEVTGAFSALGYLANNGTISGQNQGVLIGAGQMTIVNTGTIYGGQSYLQNFEDYQGSGIQMNSGASLVLDNSGTIFGDGSGIHIYDGDNYITNSGDISGGKFGIDMNDFGFNDLYPELLHVENSGTISGPAAAIRSVGTLYLTNSGVISGGVQLATAGFIENSGSINASGIAISNYENVFSLTNTGTISSTSYVAIYLSEVSGSATIVNSGTISGTTAMILSANYDSVTNTGTIFGDVILNGGDDYFDGRGGTVQGLVMGGAGSDTYVVDDAAIALVENYGEGYDVVSSSVSFTLDLGQELEELDLIGTAYRGTGNDYANTIWGNEEDNRLSGLAGSDYLFGKVGNDTLTGGADNDTLSGGDDNDLLNGSEGNDSLNGDGDNDTLTGGAGNDKLNGGVGDDSLAGGASNDTLTGGDGDDILNGGKGRDNLNGGNDEDTFVYLKLADTGTIAAGTNDIITGFVSGADKIDLSAIDAKSATAANDAFVFLGSGAFTGVAGQLHTVVSGANLILEGDVTGDGVADFQIQLNAIATISASDLVL